MLSAGMQTGRVSRGALRCSAAANALPKQVQGRRDTQFPFVGAGSGGCVCGEKLLPSLAAFYPN